MPALITHHIFGEDVVSALPHGLVEGEEELLAFLLGNQGPDPLFARFSCAPSVARRCHRLAHEMHTTRMTSAFMALREGVGRLPVPDERVGRAFVLGLLGHYALDRTAHPFVFSQQRALIEADPSLKASSHELHALIESDLDTWTLWEKRHATVEERPAFANLMRTPRICRVAGALFSQVAFSVFGIAVGAGEYAGATSDYELFYRLIEPAGSPRSRALARLERTVRGSSMAAASAHHALRSDECAAANLERAPWQNPFTGAISRESFADLFDTASRDYALLAEAFVHGERTRLTTLVAGLNYEGRPVEAS